MLSSEAVAAMLNVGSRVDMASAGGEVGGVSSGGQCEGGGDAASENELRFSHHAPLERRRRSSGHISVNGLENLRRDSVIG